MDVLVGLFQMEQNHMPLNGTEHMAGLSFKYTEQLRSSFFASCITWLRSPTVMEKRYDSPLKNLKVASPCSADWERMAGDNRKRFCGDCKLHVYNLSGMTTYDAENLLRLSEGRLCVRYFQRADGTVLTQECPVGWARVKRRLSMASAAVFGLFLSFMGLFGAASMLGRKSAIVGRIIPVASPTPDRYEVMGAVAMPSPTPKATPTPDGRWTVGQRPVAPTKIDKELRQKVLKQAGA